MNLKRKVLRMVDLRVHQYWAGERSMASSRYTQPRSSGTLTSDDTESRSYSAMDKAAEVSTL